MGIWCININNNLFSSETVASYYNPTIILFSDLLIFINCFHGNFLKRCKVTFLWAFLSLYITCSIFNFTEYQNEFLFFREAGYGLINNYCKEMSIIMGTSKFPRSNSHWEIMGLLWTLASNQLVWKTLVFSYTASWRLQLISSLNATMLIIPGASKYLLCINPYFCSVYMRW